MNYKNVLTGLASGLFLCLQIVWSGLAAEAYEPPVPPKDVQYIMGFYYGNGENILIREEAGQIELLYRYAEEDKSFAYANRYPLLKVHFDSYTINEAGPMGGSETDVHFDRDQDGYGIACHVGGHTYTRAFLGFTEGEREKTYVLPAHSEDEWQQMRALAMNTKEPPKLQKGMQVDLVNANTVPGLVVKSVYGSLPNFFGHVLYENENLYVSQDVANALTQVQEGLAPLGYGLILYDAYRPWHISKLATLALPQNNKNMLEDPDHQGSVHNTGIAVDVSLIDLSTGEELDMPSAFDEPSFRQYASYPGGTTRERYHRAVLREAMLSSGFKGSEMEWWHFELGKAKDYAHLNVAYSDLQ